MPDVYVADDSGTYRKATALYVADDSGTYRKVVNAHVADDSGTYRKVGVGQGSVINKFTVTSGPRPYLDTRVTFNVTGATKTEYIVEGEIAFRGVTATNGQDFVVVLGPDAPGKTLRIFLRVHLVSGGFVESERITHRLATLPAPSRFSATSLSSTQVRWAWDPVPGAQTYEIHGIGANGLSSGLRWWGSADQFPTGFVGGHAPSTAYRMAVRANWGNSPSGLSNVVSYTSPASPGPAPGVYAWSPTQVATWQPGSSQYAAQWRPPSDGLYHGNGAQWGSTRGNQIGFLFYGNPWAVLRGGRVTRFQIYMFRSDDAGNSVGQPNHWWLHGYTGQPGGAPQVAGGHVAGTLARGQGGWFDLPAHWGQHLVDGIYLGVAWGNTNPYYMHGPHPTQTTLPVGRVQLTLG